MSWLLIVLILVGIGSLLEREIYFYEGVHLGPRVQSWLYDRWSSRYDADKRESQAHDDETLARPLLEALGGIPGPFILDFATGTGRLAVALLKRPGFDGRIVAVDLSQGMLEQAAGKLSGMEQCLSVELLRHTGFPLPFPDAAFDAVCCLEVLELLPDAAAALDEMSRLVRPGGILLTSRGTEESGRRAKVKGPAEMTSMLEASGFVDIEIAKWWKFFDRILARKQGSSAPAGKKYLPEILTCPVCGRIGWERRPESLLCSGCGHRLQVTGRGIVLG